MSQGNLDIDKDIKDIVENSEEKVLENETPESDPNKLYNVLGVMFETTKKRYSFEVLDDIGYKKGDRVVVDTIRGKEIGVVYGEPKQLPERVLVLPLKPVLKKASDEEIEKYDTLRKEAKEAFRVCKERIQHHKLPMKLIETEYTFDKTKLIFYFTAEGRIDFRDLVKDLANIFKLRIELRQIGVRDEARILGNIGVCGKELCCRTFINKFDSVSIKMARDQGLVINPTKISGVCGRLLCCINYEYKQYEEALRVYPAVNQLVRTTKGDGKVLSISPLNGFLYVDVEGKGIMKVLIEEIKFNKKEAKKLQNVLSTEEMQLKKLEKE